MGASTINCESIQQLVEAVLPEGSQVSVDTDGYYFNVTAISDSFEGLNAVKRQQAVYKGLQQVIADGSLHAVNIKTFTEQQYESQANRQR